MREKVRNDLEELERVYRRFQIQSKELPMFDGVENSAEWKLIYLTINFIWLSHQSPLNIDFLLIDIFAAFDLLLLFLKWDKPKPLFLIYFWLE
jgi:hypothetical protein